MVRVHAWWPLWVLLPVVLAAPVRAQDAQEAQAAGTGGKTAAQVTGTGRAESSLEVSGVGRPSGAVVSGVDTPPPVDLPLQEARKAQNKPAQETNTLACAFYSCGGILMGIGIPLSFVYGIGLIPTAIGAGLCTVGICLDMVE
jgi:hypothetical protein